MRQGTPKVQVIYSPLDHSPVDDAMPERLPQARLTRTVESSDLMHTDDNINIMLAKKYMN